MEWNCVSSLSRLSCPPPKEFCSIGIKDFDFNKLEIRKKNMKRINLLKLVMHLWPGCWKTQVVSLNLCVRLDNKIKLRNSRRTQKRKTLMQEISHHEFWVFWAIILAARTKGRAGGDLWDRDDPEGWDDKVDISPYLIEKRFKAIKKYISFCLLIN